MSSSMLTDTIKTPESLQDLDDYQYDDDLSEDTILVTPFEVFPATLGELSSDQNESIDPDSICEEEGETYSYMIANARVRAALKRPIQLCKHVGIPICLMILEIELFDDKRSRQMPRLMRFKSVEVTAEFKDAEGKPKLGPEIAMFCPENYTGTPTFILHHYKTTLKMKVDPAGAIPVGFKFGFDKTHTQQFHKSCHVGIIGRALKYGSRTPIVKWDIKEDEALKQGVPKQLRLAVAVKNPGERAFNVKLNFTAYLGFNSVEFRVKKKESVLSTRVDPKLLRELALNDELGPEHGQKYRCRVDNAELTDLMLKELTNMNGSTVGKTSAFA
ncbi:hypothetical protein N431DRAFT_411063 [Stipitochalara longipes BDJ]|nr:hypothetical protein N431DRAFT_411063 [Stipitochalara longipes BDJ]